MPYYYSYPYPIHSYPHYVPIVPVYPTTTVTAASAPITQQTPGFNPLHGQDRGPAPPGIGTRVVGYVTGLAAIGPPMVGVAPIVVPQPHTSDACTNCQNRNANSAANAPASSSSPEPEPSATKPKSILKPTPTPASSSASLSSPSASSPSSPTKSKSKLEPPLNILTHANTNYNADPNLKPGC